MLKTFATNSRDTPSIPGVSRLFAFLQFQCCAVLEFYGSGVLSGFFRQGEDDASLGDDVASVLRAVFFLQQGEKGL